MFFSKPAMPGRKGAKAKSCPICGKGKIYQKCGNCGKGFKGKPAGCKNCGIVFRAYNWSCGHSTPFR